MNDDSTTPQAPTIDIRLFWFDPSSKDDRENIQMLDKLADTLSEAVNDGWEVVARTPIGNGLLYEVRRVNGVGE